MVVGAVIVGFGTSSPELLVSGLAVLQPMSRTGALLRLTAFVAAMGVILASSRVVDDELGREADQLCERCGRPWSRLLPLTVWACSGRSPGRRSW